MTHKAKVLLVDDEPNILKALSFIVQQEGHQVFTAPNGTVGLEMAREIRPDIMVLDVMMPGPNGFEIAKMVRRDPALSHCTIVFLTAKGTEQDHEHGYKSGGEIYLTKPFDNVEIVNIISEVLEFG